MNHLRSGVQDQPDQHGETPSSKKKNVSKNTKKHNIHCAKSVRDSTVPSAGKPQRVSLDMKNGSSGRDWRKYSRH